MRIVKYVSYDQAMQLYIMFISFWISVSWLSRGDYVKLLTRHRHPLGSWATWLPYGPRLWRRCGLTAEAEGFHYTTLSLDSARSLKYVTCYNQSVTIQSINQSVTLSVFYISRLHRGLHKSCAFVHSDFGELQGLSPHEHTILFGKGGLFGKEIFFISRWEWKVWKSCC